MAIKVAFIGAGSIGFTDISKRYLDRVTQLCRRDICDNTLPATITSTTDHRRARAGADDAINCTRIGGRGGEHGRYVIEAMETGGTYRRHVNSVNKG